uniref:non-specific serine/threonine protein kinase n=1 Tax=Strigamia maritima TaxID=126957 RepID=T1J745_STRMM
MADGTPSYDHLPKFIDAQTLSTKKARGTPHSRLSFCPLTLKSAPSNSRLPHISEYDSDITGKELYFDSAFVNYGLLGKGSFGAVFKMKSIEDGKFYAVKRTGIMRGRRCNRPATEVCKFQKLPNHLNVIKFHKSWQTDDHSYIQMEL